MSEVQTNPGLRIKGRLMSASEIERTLVRLAHEVVEKSNGSEGLVMIGIKRRGAPLAERLAKLISNIEKHPVETGVLDLSGRAFDYEQSHLIAPNAPPLRRLLRA